MWYGRVWCRNVGGCGVEMWEGVVWKVMVQEGAVFEAKAQCEKVRGSRDKGLILSHLNWSLSDQWWT